ncbi:MAG TPA: hypothetical protein VNB52_07750 [Ilumatobacteraceae bacterium]|nr:hypothetical protein [Ilumatobacteraceae bacterium]
MHSLGAETSFHPAIGGGSVVAGGLVVAGVVVAGVVGAASVVGAVVAGSVGGATMASVPGDVGGGDDAVDVSSAHDAKTPSTTTAMAATRLTN